MKGRPRRKAAAGEKDEEDNVSTCSTPVKGKENVSPARSKGRLSFDTHQQQFITLLKDFDQNVTMTKKDIQTHMQVVAENLTLPFLTALMKLPVHVKNMKWGDYVRSKSDPSQALATIKSQAETNQHKFAVPTAGTSKMETPAIRTSSRLAKNKLPVITPKFDPATPATVIKRLPKPGEMLVSMKGSPVAIPNAMPLSSRGISNLAVADEKDMLVALLNNPETLSNALKDKNTCKAFVKAYNNAKKIKD